MKRVCSKCKKEKVLNVDNFYKTPRNTLGFHMACKECMIEKQKANNAKLNMNRDWTKILCG